MKFALALSATILASATLANAATDPVDAGHSFFKIEQPEIVAGDQRHTNVYYGEPVYGEEYALNARLVYIKPADDNCNSFIVPDLDKGKNYIFLYEWSPYCITGAQELHAQQQGAIAVVLGSLQCLCDEQNKDPNLFNRFCDEDTCLEKWPTIQHSGESTVTIPTILIPKLDAMRLSDCIQSSDDESYEVRAKTSCPDSIVTVELFWSLPKPDGHVEWEIFQNAGSTSSVGAITDSFKKFAVAISQDSTFTPHFLVADHYGCDKESRKDSQFCTEFCSEGGRYCLNYYGAATYPGRELVESSLRQLCVWDSQFADSYGKNRTHAELYWTYRQRHNAECSFDADVALPFVEICDRVVHETVGLDWESTMRCVGQSGGYGGFDHQNTGKPYNKVFERELARQRNLNVVALPALAVNEVVIRGGASTNSVMKNVCTGYKDGTEPQICEWVEKHDVLRDQISLEEYLERNGRNGYSGMQVFGIVAVSFLTLSLVSFAVIRVSRRRMEKGMRDEMHDILRRYVPMDEVENGENQGGTTAAEIHPQRGNQQARDDFTGQLDPLSLT